MRMLLNIKGKKIFNPSNNDIIIYDGQDWYVTTKEDILKETKELLDDCGKVLKELKKENENLRRENDKFKKDTAKQLLTMSELIEKVIK